MSSSKIAPDHSMIDADASFDDESVVDQHNNQQPEQQSEHQPEQQPPQSTVPYLNEDILRLIIPHCVEPQSILVISDDEVEGMIRTEDSQFTELRLVSKLFNEVITKDLQNLYDGELWVDDTIDDTRLAKWAHGCGKSWILEKTTEMYLEIPAHETEDDDGEPCECIGNSRYSLEAMSCDERTHLGLVWPSLPNLCPVHPYSNSLRRPLNHRRKYGSQQAREAALKECFLKVHAHLREKWQREISAMTETDDIFLYLEYAVGCDDLVLEASLKDQSPNPIPQRLIYNEDDWGPMEDMSGSESTSPAENV